MNKLLVAVALALSIAGLTVTTVAASAEATKTAPAKKKKRPAAKKPAASAAAAAATAAAAPAAAETQAAAAAQTPAQAGGAEQSEEEKVVKTDLYTVKGGIRVDEKTMNGFRAWRGAACDRCHGANQEGMVGPSLLDSMKKLTRDEFKTTITSGRLEKGMPSFNTSEQVMKNLDNLYAYLKGRADGAITRAKVMPLE